jgi:tetratricopeptide (TPR) repeat protein
VSCHGTSDERSPLLAIGILTDLARQLRWAGRHDSALRLFNLALDQLPNDRAQFNAVRAMLWSNKAWELASIGNGCIPEARNALSLAFDLQAEANAEDQLSARHLMHVIPSPDATDKELISTAAAASLVLAQHDQKLLGEAERHALRAVAHNGEPPERSGLLDLIRLARVRFAAGEPEQAAQDGQQAIMMATNTTSAMVTTRLRDLMADSEPYSALARVREFRECLRHR